MAYQILTPVHDFKPGDIRRADEFPLGTDFERLARLGVAWPTDGEPAPVADGDAEGWKKRALAAESELSNVSKAKPDAGSAEKLKKAYAEIKALNARIEELKTQSESERAEYTRKLSDMGNAGQAVLAAQAERDEALRENASLKLRLGGTASDEGKLESGAETATDEKGESQNGPETLTPEGLNDLSYEDIQAKAKEMGISANQGKEALKLAIAAKLMEGGA